MLHELPRFLRGKKHVKLFFRPSWRKVLLLVSITSLKGLERLACQHVHPGPVEVRFRCHEVELGSAALFDEPIRRISAEVLCDHLLDDNVWSSGLTS